MKRLIGIATMVVAISATAQVAEERKIVDKLCGCFEVDFKYAETFSPNPDYKYHEREETGGTAELALPIEVSDKKIVIQHLLVVGPSTVVKHWREEWTYENPVIWKYKGDRTWIKETLTAETVKGKWTQTVWEVADEPRYQGFSQFVNLDGKMIWQSTTDAPLPRREYSVRSDYNILRRTNRLNITDSGYLHEQDNQKIIRTNGTDKLLVEEKGHNSYKRIADKECAAAKEYWEKNGTYWGKVRTIWADYISTHDRVTLKNKIDDKFLHEYLINLGKEYLSEKISDADIDKKIKDEISRFIS
ncbi:MAG: hypothetical protein JNM19_15630 [Chitinophagaceae bacterium]|nr:hypothetical protein [Chitinophagaceae bacterium]